MDKTYKPKDIEQKWYQFWKSNDYFSPSGEVGNSYCIMIPPPNVTGTLHMGHAFNNTLMDCLVRYHRMCGYNTLWQPGTDHAGIATQMVVERQLNAENKTRHDLGREKFVDKVWEWKERSGNTIYGQLERMGSSLDWSRERFTMDEGLSEAVKQVFVRLYDEGLIYRGKRLVNWDPKLHTAVSDLEVLSEEENGHMWHMRYPLVDAKMSDGNDYLIVATTRPETMLGDSAVAVHPEDERYKGIIGKKVKLPLTEREIPIIADDYVDPEFGSGCVKITPAHDFNDYEVGQRHDLEIINIFTIDAKINDNAPAAYQGLDRYEARKKIVTDLEELGLLAEVKDHKLMVPRGDRSGVVVEPYLTDQWYVKIQPLADPAIKAVKDGDIQFVPENWSKTYFEWMNNIQDWCISRQLWWGHRIPAWYDNEGNIYVAEDEATVRKKYKLDANIELSQDEDVLDTWFSSALWPFSTLGWPEQTPELKTFYPSSVLITGFDIIFFWVARMIMMGLKFMDNVPFEKVYIHGLVRDADGQKMSKSKGNVLDPIDIIDGIDLEKLIKKRTTDLMQPEMASKIEKATRKQYPDGIKAYGTDAMRFSFAAQASTGRDIKFDLNRIEGYRNFCNKLWNATRFVLMNCKDKEIASHIDKQKLTLADRWILCKQQEVIDLTHKHLNNYRFDLVAQALYEFSWHEFCDWYVELCKPTLFKDDVDESIKQNSRRVLLEVLENLLKLLHPIIPFLTEEIWQPIAKELKLAGNSISTQDFPRSNNDYVDVESLEELEWSKEFINGIRKIRSEMEIPPGKPLRILLQNWSIQDQSYFENSQQYIYSLAKVENIEWLKDDAAPESATALVGEMKILIPLAGLIDKDAESARLEKEIKKLESNIEKSLAKLNNPNFSEKAPADVVNKERERVSEMQTSFQQLKEQLDKITKL
ncbi:MAG: valine--tRNA ligase [Gammaproteobacteria bacterium]|nr:valine--tRNA ligase [Gammaproteobacteria bacterium]